MKKEAIKKNALEQFVNRGYDGTSLEDIVTNIGIKKQSVYSHFKNKEDIFMQVVNDAVENEIQFVDSFFNDNKENQLAKTLYNFLLSYKDRYLIDECLQLKFLLRMTFMPPYNLQNTISHQFQLYNKNLINSLKNEFIRTDYEEIDIDSGIISFQTLLDGILVELIYSESNEKDIGKKIDLSWKVYCKGMGLS